MKPIFSRNSDIDKTAYLNWRISNDEILNLLNLADGYMLSAIELAKKCVASNEDKQADILIFPIFSNANHGIELYLKAITWILNKLADSDLRIEGKHNINQIFRMARAKIRKYNGQLSFTEFENATQNLQFYLQELAETINATPKSDKMDFSRYPFTNDYQNHFYVGRLGNVEIDLENFISRFEIIKENLENISDFLYWQELNQEW